LLLSLSFATGCEKKKEPAKAAPAAGATDTPADGAAAPADGAAAPADANK
jgi:hypothetical protein